MTHLIDIADLKHRHPIRSSFRADRNPGCLIYQGSRLFGAHVFQPPLDSWERGRPRTLHGFDNQAYGMFSSTASMFYAHAG